MAEALLITWGVIAGAVLFAVGYRRGMQKGAEDVLHALDGLASELDDLNAPYDRQREAARRGWQ